MRGTLKEILANLAKAWGLGEELTLKRVTRLNGKRSRDPELKYEATELDAEDCRRLDLTPPAYEFRGGGGEPFIVFPSAYRDKDQREAKIVCVTKRGERQSSPYISKVLDAETPPKRVPPNLFEDDGRDPES